MGSIVETHPTAVFNPHALPGFALFAERPKKHANYCTDTGFLFPPHQILLILSSQFIYSSKWLAGAEMFVFYYSPMLESAW